MKSQVFIRTIIVLTSLLTLSSAHAAKQVIGHNNTLHAFDLTKKVNGIDFLVTDIYKNPSKSIVLFGSRTTYEDGSKLLTSIQLTQDKKTIWKGDGIFSNVSFSQDGETVLIVRLTKRNTEVITIKNGVALSFFEHYEHEQELKFSEISRKYEISNDGSQILIYDIDDETIKFTELCTFNKSGSFDSCVEVSTTIDNINRSTDITLSNANEIYMLFFNRLIKKNGENTEWEVKFEGNNIYPFVSLLNHTRFIIALNETEIRVYDKENGNLVWSKAHQHGSSSFGNFINAKIIKNYLMIPLNDKNTHGRINLSTL
ncbi:hypothetical protein ACMAZF_16005 [Psychrobium sp. nBUS_13]|jgi:hypothetical protein|uniref:hypothetical protein n=1 Tax=Psychrobium sp. nBUS_13 TaxID=3395319 RepID=UPI003EBA6A7A